MLARWTKDGAFPELYDPRMLAHDDDYVQAYQEQCAVLGIRTRIYAFASDGMVFTRFPWGKQAEFIGYDCVGETGFCSYLYWDNPSGEELAGIGLHTNANSLFAARQDGSPKPMKAACGSRNPMMAPPQAGRDKHESILFTFMKEEKR
ncbi:MAG: hypothetical protein ACI4ME_05980 [Aristaeellaceae bacterium]